MSGVISALVNLTTALSGFGPTAQALETCVCNFLGQIATNTSTGGPLDVSGIVKQLTQINTDAQVLETWKTALTDSGAVPQEFSALMQGTTWQQILAMAINLPGYILGLGIDALTGKTGRIDKTAFAPIGNWIWSRLLAGFKIAAPDAAALAAGVGSDAKQLAGLVDNAVTAVFGGTLTSAISIYESGLAGLDLSVDSDVDLATQRLIGHAFEFGVGAHLLATIPELAYFTKNLGLGQMAALIATLAGFEEVAHNVHGPFTEAVLHRPSTYRQNRAYPTKLPAGKDAALMRSRGILLDAEYNDLIAADGYGERWRSALLAQAYTGLSPRMMIRVMETGIFSDAELTDELTYAGLRPTSQTRMIRAAQALALAPFRQKALAAITTAYERGLYTDAQLNSFLPSFDLPPGAEEFIHLEAAARKLVQTTDIYEKETSAAYKFGLIDDTAYRTQLEAIGLNTLDIDFRLGRDAINRQGKQLQESERAAARQAALDQRIGVSAALENFAKHNIDTVGLTAALVAIGLPLAQVVPTVALANERRQGNLVAVYDQLLPRAQATLLNDKVAAIKEQTIKNLITTATAKPQLLALGIGEPWAQALVSRWAAQAEKVILPP